MNKINWEEYRKQVVNWQSINDPNFKPIVISGRNALGMKWVIVREALYDINIHIKEEGYTWHGFGTDLPQDETIYKTVEECVENSPITVNHKTISKTINSIE